MKFFTQETERAGCGDFNYGNFYSLFMSWGLMGPDMKRFFQLSKSSCMNYMTKGSSSKIMIDSISYLDTRVLTQFSDPAVMMKSWSVKTIVDAIKASEPGMKQR